MNAQLDAIDRLDDAELIDAVKSLAVVERHATARLVVGLAEMERRRLYLSHGCSSLYDYCLQSLRMSEDAAYARSRVARLGVQFPVVLRDLKRRRSAARRCGSSPCLTPENHATVLGAVRMPREAEGLVATLNPC